MRRTKQENKPRLQERPARLQRGIYGEIVDIRTVNQLREELRGYVEVVLADETQNFHKWVVRFGNSAVFPTITITTLKGGTFDECMFMLKGG